MVSSPAGGAPEFLVHGRNALLASTEREWTDHLRTPHHGRRDTRTAQPGGRETVENSLSLQAQSPVLADLVHSVIEDTRLPGGDHRE